MGTIEDIRVTVQELKAIVEKSPYIFFSARRGGKTTYWKTLQLITKAETQINEYIKSHNTIGEGL